MRVCVCVRACVRAFVKYSCVRSVVMDSSISYYVPVILLFIIGVPQHGLWRIFTMRHWWSV